MTAATTAQLIKKTPGVCGGEACTGDRRITVWMLVNARRIGISDDQLLERYSPPITTNDLAAAWEYYATHREEIDRAIQRNDEAP